MLDCNGFGGASAPVIQTVGVTQQQVECVQLCDQQLEAIDPMFYLLVIDALERLASTAGFNVSSALIANLTSSDLQEATNNAICSLEERGLTSVDPMKAKAFILAQLNNLLCAA